jgi:hypothetical protein
MKNISLPVADALSCKFFSLGDRGITIFGTARECRKLQIHKENAAAAAHERGLRGVTEVRLVKRRQRRAAAAAAAWFGQRQCILSYFLNI